jgi:hypothetical protein
VTGKKSWQVKEHFYYNLYLKFALSIMINVARLRWLTPVTLATGLARKQRSEES